MQIYNITKERVSELVNKAFESEDRPKDLCLCYQCRLDVMCHVLNRAKPVYVLSERGIAHLKDNYSASLQDLADLTMLVENGIQLVSKAKREHHLDPEKSEVIESEAYFNFPTITGVLLAGETFAPVAANVTLKIDGKLVEMKDSKWFNPMSINDVNNGYYLFWPKAIPSSQPGIYRKFVFQLDIESDDFENTTHFFDLEITSEKELNEEFQAHQTHTCSNILLFKPE